MQVQSAFCMLPLCTLKVYNLHDRCSCIKPKCHNCVRTPDWSVPCSKVIWQITTLLTRADNGSSGSPNSDWSHESRNRACDQCTDPTTINGYCCFRWPVRLWLMLRFPIGNSFCCKRDYIQWLKCHWTQGNAVPAPPVTDIQRSYTQISFKKRHSRPTTTCRDP